MSVYTTEMGCALCLTLTKMVILEALSVKRNESFVKTQNESTNVLYKWIVMTSRAHFGSSLRQFLANASCLQTTSPLVLVK